MAGAMYSPAFKAKIVERLMRPNAPSANSVAREVGVPQVTLSRWLRQSLTLDGMSQKRAKNKQKKERWSAEEKLRIVVESSQLAEEELGAYLRQEGVHSTQLEQWHATIRGAWNGGQPVAARRQALKDKKRIQALERELRRKDKALAESAALLWLKKKAQDIWGDEDDDTSRKNGE
jgi:transposase